MRRRIFKTLKELDYDADSFAGCGRLQNRETAEEWLHILAQMESPDTWPAG